MIIKMVAMVTPIMLINLIEFPHVDVVIVGFSECGVRRRDLVFAGAISELQYARRVES